MSEVGDVEDRKPPAPPISDTNLDDTGELDYEPSEPSANSIKEAVSDDEEEGEAGESDTEQRERPDPTSNGKRLRDDDDDVAPGHEKSAVENDEYSGPEEGEVDELEEGEVKDESDSESKEDRDQLGGGARRDRSEQSEELAKQIDTEVKQEPKRRVPITAPSAGDGRTKITPSTNDARPEDAGLCKFFLRGQCTWGSFCKFLHPTGDRPLSPADGEKVRRVTEVSSPCQPAVPVPLMAVKADPPPSSSITRAGSPPPESAWERGLKQARERIKKASEKKEVDPDFEHKRLTMPLGPAIAALDEVAAAFAVESQSPNLRPAPRPLMEFSRSIEGHQTEPLPSAPHSPYGRGPAFDGSASGNRSGYERRQQPMSLSRQSRNSVDDVYSRSSQVVQGSRAAGSYDRSYGNDRRDVPPSTSPPSVCWERRQHGDDYAAAPVVPHRLSQEVVSPHRSSVPYYHHRHSTSASEYNAQQPHDGKRFGDRDDREAQRRRLEPEPQGWEYRRSPPSYYRERYQEPARIPEAERDNVARKSYDADRREPDHRRPLQQQKVHRSQPDGSRTNQQQQQQQYRPPNYHYYRTLQQQQQNKDKNRVGGQERKTGNDYSRDRERERSHARGRNDYNFHYYNTKDRQHQQSGSRPLPYERPSYTRQEHHGQWRDPWRRSPSPTGRQGAVNASGGRGKGIPSPDDDGSVANSLSGDEAFERRRRRRSASSSASRSSRSSVSSVGSIGSQGPRAKRRPSPGVAGGRRSSSERTEPLLRERSAASSRSSADAPRRNDQHRSTGSPALSRGSRHERYKRTSRDYSPSRAGRIGASKRDSGDVASRAAAKALGDRLTKSPSPFDGPSPKRYRRAGSGGTSGGRLSAASVSSNQDPKRDYHRHRSPTPVQSPAVAARQTPPTRPLSPPPPAPFLAAAAPHIGRKTTENPRPKHGSTQSQQRSEQARKPIKMTIMNKSKVKTNIYEAPMDVGGTATGAVFNDDDDDMDECEETVTPHGDSHVSPSHSADEAPTQKKTQQGTDSGSGSGGENKVLSRREELLRQLRAVESAIDAKRKRDKPKKQEG